MDYKKEPNPYCEYMREHVGYVRLIKSVGIYMVKYRYLVYYKILKLMKYGGTSIV